MRRTLLAVALVLLPAGAGCGPGLHLVRGKVTLEDGTPVTRGLVVFESTDAASAVTARGEIQPDGSYQLSTSKPGDGVPPGRYKVLLNPLDLSDVPDEQKDLPFDIKYLRFETSGLEYDVKAGPNEYVIQVNRPAKKKPR
jgi:hypothetical protein